MPLLENGAISSSLRSMRLVHVDGTDRDHERVVAGLVDRSGAPVARRDHDGDPGGPRALHGGVQRVERVGLDAVGSEREVQHLDPVLRAMRDDPLERRDHDRDVGRSVRAGDLHRDELRAGGDPAPLAVGGGAVPGDHAGEVRAVPVLVVAGAAWREVHASDDAITQVLDLCDPGVDHRDRDAGPVDPGGDLREPDRLPPREVRLDVVPGLRADGRHLDVPVGVEAEDRGGAPQRGESVGRYVGGEPADQGKGSRDVSADGPDEVLGEMRLRGFVHGQPPRPHRRRERQPVRGPGWPPAGRSRRTR